MTEPVPLTELSAFSSANATPTDWSRARDQLAGAEVYWLSTVRPDGRPHVTPLLGVWLEGALYFCTGPQERKAKNLSEDPHCVLTTGQSTLDGLDLVIEGTAESVSDSAELGQVAAPMSRSTGRILSHPMEPGPVWVTPFGEQRFSCTAWRPRQGLDLAREHGSAKQAGASGSPRSPVGDMSMQCHRLIHRPVRGHF